MSLNLSHLTSLGDILHNVSQFYTRSNRAIVNSEPVMYDDFGRRSPFAAMLPGLSVELYGLNMLPSWFLKHWDDFIPLGSIVDDLPIRFLDDLEVLYVRNENWDFNGLTNKGYEHLQRIRKNIVHGY